MPSRAARWMSAIVSRSNVTDSRSPGCQSARPRAWTCHQYAPDVVDVEVVELPRRPVAAELRRVGVAIPAPASSSRSCAEVLVAHLLLDAVGARARHRPADVQPRLVERVAERLAGVAAHHQAALLGHERAHVADRAADDDVGALERDPAPRRRVAVDHEQAAAAGRPRRLAGAAVDHDRARHHVLGHARRRSCRARARSRACSCRRSSSRRGPRSRPRSRRRGRPPSRAGRRVAHPQRAVRRRRTAGARSARGPLSARGRTTSSAARVLGRGHHATGAVPQL